MALQEKVSDEFETCICGCNQLTDVRKDTHTDARGEYYLQGCGQFRPECYTRIYGPRQPVIADETITKLELNEFGILA